MWTRSIALATVATVAVGLSSVASTSAARAAVPQTRTAAAVSPLAVAGAGHFVDLGLLTANNAPVGITNDDQVALRNGWWRNGVLTPPPTPAGAVGPMSIEAMTGTGLIVGAADFNSGANNLRVVGWRPSASVTPSVFPPQCESGGMPFFAEGSYAASTDDEVAVGASGFCYDHPDYAMSTTFGSSTYTQIPGLGFPYSLRKDWALGYRPGNTGADPALRLDRRTGVTTPLPVTVGLNEQDLAPDGTVIGSDVVTHVGETIAADGRVTPLPLLPGYATVNPIAIADNDLIVGLAADSSSNPTRIRAVMWPTPTSTPVDLTSRFPAGWVPAAAHVNIHGHMTGLAKDTNGAYHVFFSDGPVSDAALRISSVTINPALPKVADRIITGTATVVNDGTTDTVTGVVVGVGNTTPTVVSVSGRPTPGSIGSLAAGASARVTFRLTPRKSGEASLTITARGQTGETQVTATPRVRRFTIGSVITLSLTRLSGPDVKGRTTVRATVRNLGSLAVSGVVLRIGDVTGARIAASIGRPSPASLVLARRESKSFITLVALPLVGAYHLRGTASGRVAGTTTSASSALTVTRLGSPVTVTVSQVFAVPQIGQRGRLVVKVVNHLNENLKAVTTTVAVATSRLSGRATVGAVPGPLGLVGAGATVTVPATLTYPGKVTFRVVVTAKGARTARRVAVTATVGPTVTKPVLTVTANTSAQYRTQPLAQDFRGSAWSTAGGPINLFLEDALAHPYSQRAAFHGTLTLPLWPHHSTGGQGRPVPAEGCWAVISAQQGAYRAKVKVVGKTDRLLLFADGDPHLSTNMLLCKNELTYVNQTPGTAMYMKQKPGERLTLVVAQAGRTQDIWATNTLNVCVGLTDGVRSVRVKAAGTRLEFTIAASRCGA